MWDYAKANKDEIRKCLSNTDWDSKFENLSYNDMVSEFMTTVLDILSRFIPNKIDICKDKNPRGLLPRLKQQLKVSIELKQKQICWARWKARRVGECKSYSK